MKAATAALRLSAITLLAGVVSVVASGQAQAACTGDPGDPGSVYGRVYECGYFTDMVVGNSNSLDKILTSVGATQYDGLTVDWDTNPITYASFVDSLHDRVFDSTSFVNEARASAIIDIMLGRQGPDFGGSAASGVAYAQAHWTDWVNLVGAYSSGSFPGFSVNFHDFYDYTGVTQAASGIFANDPSGTYECFTTLCYPDIAFENDLSGAPETDWSVVFTYPAGRFAIMDWCGNLTGDVGAVPLPPPPPPTPTPTPPPPPPPTNAGEIIIMNPALYLNPPFGFDDAAFNGELEGQGERPPLF